MKVERGQSDKPEVKIGDTVSLAEAPMNAVFSIDNTELGLVNLQRIDNGFNIPFGFTSLMEQDKDGKWQPIKAEASGKYCKSLLFNSPEEAEVTIVDLIVPVAEELS